MRKKVLLKDMLREIWKTRNRFLSILAIVAIGTGFFAGVKASCPDMKLTAEEHFKKYNLMDIHLVSTMGFTEDDVKALQKETGVRGAMPAYSTDMFLSTGSKSDVIVKVLSYAAQSGSENDINLPVLKEGRLPQAPGECVVEQNIHTPQEFKIGNTITLNAGERDKDTKDVLANDTFQIVGIVESPAYITFDRGNTLIGDGVIDAFVMIPETDFALDVYTDVFLTLDETLGMSPFDDVYKKVIEERVKDFEQLAAVRTPIRYKEVLDEANAKLDEAKRELQEGIEKQQSELADAQKKIDDAAKELADGKNTYKKELNNFNEQIADARKKLDQADEELDEGAAEYRDGKQQYLEGLKEFQSQKPKALAQLQDLEMQADTLEKSIAVGEEQMGQLTALIGGIIEVANSFESVAVPPNDIPQEVQAVIAASAKLGVGLDSLLTQYVTMDSANPEKQALKQQILGTADAVLVAREEELQTGKDGLAQMRQGIASGYQNLADAEEELRFASKELSAASKQIADGRAKLEEKEKEFLEQKEKGEQELAKALAELNNGEAELEQARTDFRQGKEDSDREIEDGRLKISDAEKEISEIEEPEWYIWDRTNNPGYATYQEDAEKVDAIAKVFPVFFILVAALVCLTTMTRMVEEQRTQIGTLKALGYSRGSIMAKYISYAVLASLAGSVIGLVVGLRLFPIVIINAYRMMYNMPAPLTPFHWDYAFWITLAAVACTGISALAACYKEMYSCPAQLMRPKAPKAGKRILLENIKFIWSRFSFTQKVTIRNIFRYKKRVLMTVIGIAGCTALMLTGFGLKYAITSIVPKQYEEIFIYDAIAAIDDKIAPQELKELESKLAGTQELTDSMLTMHKGLDVSNGTVKKSVNIFVPKEAKRISDFINLQTRIDKKPLTLSDDGVIINEKLAKLLKLEVGSTLIIHHTDFEPAEVTVKAITENYTMNYVYMTPAFYEKVFATQPQYNTFIFNMQETVHQSEVSNKLLGYDHVMGISYTTDGSIKFGDMIASLSSVVWVLILSAGALAFIVLYNLTNINVNERLRELATIKVLGFYDKEVSAYIYRENTISSVIGMLVGLVAGVFLEKFVIFTAEVDMVMFAPDIALSCFVNAGLLTMLFTLIINVVLHFQLKKIDMVESLKSIE